MQGISTVLVTVVPEESAQARPPRALVPRGLHPGCSFALPDRDPDPVLGRRIVNDALELLLHPSEPGTIVTRDYG
jgi:hypothetical protein